MTITVINPMRVLVDLTKLPTGSEDHMIFMIESCRPAEITQALKRLPGACQCFQFILFGMESRIIR